MRDLSRRNLLKASAAVGAGAVVAPGLMAGGTPGIAADGSGVGVDGPDSAVDGSGAPLGARHPKAKLTGRIVRPQNPGYPSASLGWDELFVHYPLVIVFAQETQDVVNALTWARQNNVALRVRSGRHSLEGWSNVDNGIVIDVSELKGAHIDPAARIARVGAGLNQLEAVTTLGEYDLAATTGTEGSVGLSGATLGGGFGFLTRYLGMACDNLVGAEIVVASGADGAEVLQVDPWKHSDLLWALRGAGNGNFGIVTSLTYKVAPLKRVAYVQATWEGLGDLYRVFDTWQRFAPFADPRLGTQVEVHKSQILFFGVLAEGSEAEARHLLEPLLSIGRPEVTVQIGGWGDVYAGFQIPTEDEPANWKFFSQFVQEPFPRRAISVIGSFLADAPSEDSNYFTQAFGTGMQRREPFGGTAFPHRDSLFYGEPGIGWGTRGEPDSGDALTARAQTWIAEFSQALRPYVDGAYVNVPNIGMAEWEKAYWGHNFARLRKIKAKYDPHNVFQYEQSVPPATC
ncbi:FAD-binding oxidoreductase [Micromonospora mirobrigensis]|uniref:Tat (Twin-arginine translocation) pathway signal sequence n=1 Tax=Micromonospora mirobrigensis TaxID=262898 RepID=A0A1C5ALT5_9ACTN|nr:FAD-binding oxidoreductase [Micromonospora mirobrigensis]SCF46169.1 Tat (twin-arginine translocation) pathway signal sequence [Micromonospora mirobrigensis]